MVDISFFFTNIPPGHEERSFGIFSKDGVEFWTFSYPKNLIIENNTSGL